MLELSMLLIALTAPGAPVYRPPRQTPPAQAEAATPDETLSDDEVRAHVANYLGAIDVPVTADQWRALGPRAVPLLEKVVSNPGELPSRRAAALGGLAAIGGTRARALVVKAARSEEEPFAVRAAALRGASRVLKSGELVKQLKPVLEGAGEPATRAVAAEVLARHAPASACPAVRAQADREGEGRARFERALERCGP